ncbi:RNA polymerase sigma-70 factor [Dyadobacter beijingensis]|uniref:RNA polymerase sigma-70 factor n=2 Tax=Dyadobacter beijingensis TaxID=365489 RepID=A0ABQ2HJC0_9BACT|nr:RNA polymerase sigma-70 factor [Dyadobacter beijingensis]
MLYKTHIEVLYRYGHKLTGDTQLVEDSIQDMFIELWNSRQRLSDTDSIKYYLFRVLRRKITQHPLNRNAAGAGAELSAFEHRFFSHSTESELIDTENELGRTHALGHALTQLPPRQQEVVNLRYYHEFNHQQIAEIMNISLQSVHNTLQKSMKGLRELLFQKKSQLLG